MKIPTWEEALKKCAKGKDNPIDRFVYEFEPSYEHGAEKFRKLLKELVKSIEKKNETP